MYSLPNITAMNVRAAHNRSALNRKAKRGPSRRDKCDCGDPALECIPVYDIFSKDIKDMLHVCENERCRYLATEGLFFCNSCSRWVFRNYTWETYFRETEDGEECLACAAERHFTQDNLIDPATVQSVIIQSGLPFLENGVLNISATPRVLANKQPVPDHVKFVDNCEFDMTSGSQISGDNILDVIRKAGPCWLVIDATYQFALSIGVYVPNEQWQLCQ